MRGRDADVVMKECDEVMERLSKDVSVSKRERAHFEKRLKEVKAEASAESALEKGCAKWVTRIFMITTFLPLIITMMGRIQEFVMRPSLNLDSTLDLSDTTHLITGGCSGMGLEVAKMFAQRGANVVVGCRDEDKLSETLSLLHSVIKHHSSVQDLDDEYFDDDDKEEHTEAQFFQAHFLDMESFESVQSFSERVAIELTEKSIDTIVRSIRSVSSFEHSNSFQRTQVHNAASNEACRETVDGVEVALQVNYLSPFLLNRNLGSMLDPKSGRVVHVTCDPALKEADWLPWPLRRVHPSLLPRLDMTKLFGKISKTCDPSLAFANSKLAALFHSKELDRRFSEEHLDESESTSHRRKRQRRFKRLPIRKTSNAVNPGPTATGRDSQIPTSPQQRMSMRQRICQYFPPVWIIGKVATFLNDNFGEMMLRPIEVGSGSIVHVATSDQLRGRGGGLYSDQAGTSLTDCSNSDRCGWTPQPEALSNETLSRLLWDRTEDMLMNEFDL